PWRLGGAGEAIGVPEPATPSRQRARTLKPPGPDTARRPSFWTEDICYSSRTGISMGHTGRGAHLFAPRFTPDFLATNDGAGGLDFNQFERNAKRRKTPMRKYSLSGLLMFVALVAIPASATYVCQGTVTNLNVYAGGAVTLSLSGGQAMPNIY